MKKLELDKKMKEFDRSGSTVEDLNTLRSEIFNSLDKHEIREETKNRLLKDLYRSASIKGIFFIRITERKTQDLPRDFEEERKREEEEDEYEDEESYEESYEEDEDEEYLEIKL